MRVKLLILALGLSLSTRAAADVTIRYAPDPPGDGGMVIEADGQGRIRAEIMPGQFLIMRDGDVFIVVPSTPTIARIDDFIAVVSEAGREYRGSRAIQLRSPAADTPYRLSERGPETVGNWPGTRVAIEQVGQHNPDHDIEWVVSSDPALAEVGRIMARIFETQIRIGTAFLGAQPRELTALTLQLEARGAPLRVRNSYRLESVSFDPVPASRFDLPGPVMTREQLRALRPH